MAIPDPDMEEMQLMAYEYRHRNCKALQRVPCRNNFIEVLWCIDYRPGNETEWCLAEVLHVSDSPEQGTLASGVILYMPTADWGEQAHKVDFLENYKLRRSKEPDDSTLGSDENENPALDWKFGCDNAELSAQRDKDWIPKQPVQGGNSEISKSTTHIERREDDSRSLRSAYASLSVEMQKVKREMVKLSKRISDVQQTDTVLRNCTGAGCVIPWLRHRLALKLQAALRSIQITIKKRGLEDSEQNLSLRTGDGLQVGAMKARVQCTLQQFECIARQVKATVKPESTYFFPDFSYTQLPLQSSAAFRILFSSFSDLADHLGISSMADKLEMMRKCGTGRQGDLLRMLGTYCFNKRDETKPACIYLATSCGDEEHCEAADESGETSQADQLYSVLKRESREWNKVDRRFVRELHLEQVLPPKLKEAASELETFSLQWKRAPEIGSRMWSRALTEPGQVFGYLEVNLPFIQTQGKYLCTEVGGLASDDMWEELLRR